MASKKPPKKAVKKPKRAASVNKKSDSKLGSSRPVRTPGTESTFNRRVNV